MNSFWSIIYNSTFASHALLEKDMWVLLEYMHCTWNVQGHREMSNPYWSNVLIMTV